jgi:F0F1-type ATP synthase epsilon subunit
MSTFPLRIVTPDLALPPREVESLDVPAEEGRLTVLARHQPMICLVRAGRARIAAAGRLEDWTIAAGVLRVDRQETVLLTPTACPAATPGGAASPPRSR